MVLFYFAAGFFVIFTTSQFQNFQDYQRHLLGGMIIAYGLFRLYKVIKISKADDQDEE